MSIYDVASQLGFSNNSNFICDKNNDSIELKKDANQNDPVVTTFLFLDINRNRIWDATDFDILGKRPKLLAEMISADQAFENGFTISPLVNRYQSYKSVSIAPSDQNSATDRTKIRITLLTQLALSILFNRPSTGFGTLSDLQAFKKSHGLCESDSCSMAIDEVTANALITALKQKSDELTQIPKPCFKTSFTPSEYYTRKKNVLEKLESYRSLMYGQSFYIGNPGERFSQVQDTIIEAFQLLGYMESDGCEYICKPTSIYKNEWTVIKALYTYFNGDSLVGPIVLGRIIKRLKTAN